MGYDSSVQNIYGGNGGSASPALTEGGGFYYSLTRHIDEEMMWQMNLRMNEEVMEGRPYPERLGQPDCAYYMRTGLCRFGMTCRYNHPPNRKLAVVAATMRGGYPERIGQPECEYYLKTGTCKFGATCKFHHPKEKAGIAGRGAQLNESGYPLRMNEVECAYYLRTGQCKFGSTCKFHHPEPSNMVRPLHSSIYPTVHSPSTAQQSYPGALTNWPAARASFIPSPRWQGISNYAQMILPQELVQVPGWNPYTGQLGSASPSPNQQQARGNGQYYSSPRQAEMSTAGTPPGSFSPYHIGSLPSGVYELQRDNVFPERPNEPECQFFMKTGECKFGPVCRFHHPRERTVSIPDCMLSSLGLPLRPGEPVCVFYSRYGICKFSINCKFDHPTTVFPYGGTPSYSTDVPIQNFGPSPSEPVTLTLPLPQVSVDAVETNNKPRRLSSLLSASDEKPEPKG